MLPPKNSTFNQHYQHLTNIYLPSVEREYTPKLTSPKVRQRRVLGAPNLITTDTHPGMTGGWRLDDYGGLIQKTP